MDVRFVLVETSHPGNIGAAARALRVMGFGDLALVRPQRYPHAEATAMAAGANDVLERATVCDSLDEAIADCSAVFGTSARRRTLGWPEVDARAGAVRAAAGDGRAAFVFGRERTGLTNEELDRCQFMLHIPTDEDYGSLNLAQAVQIVSYECRMAIADTAETQEREAMPTRREMEYFFEHLEQTMLDTGFLDPDNPKQLMRRLRRFFHRSEPTQIELNILRGILKHARDPSPGSATRRRMRDSPSRREDATIPKYHDQD